MHEDGLASDRGIPVFVFERKGFPIHYPIPYVTDYMLFDPYTIEDILNIQKLAKEIGKIPPKWITAGFGALVGAIFGGTSTVKVEIEIFLKRLKIYIFINL